MLLNQSPTLGTMFIVFSSSCPNCRSGPVFQDRLIDDLSTEDASPSPINPLESIELLKAHVAITARTSHDTLPQIRRRITGPKLPEPPLNLRVHLMKANSQTPMRSSFCVRDPGSTNRTRDVTRHLVKNHLSVLGKAFSFQYRFHSAPPR